ncbi:MAG: SPW repeat protein [Actinomycetota bacterium]
MKARSRWPDGLNLVLAVWLFLSPWLLSTSGTAAAAWISWLLAVAVAVIAVIGLAVPRATVDEGAGVVVGAALFLSPWVFGFADVTRAATNSWLVGAAVVLLSLWGVRESRQLTGSSRLGAHA